MDQVRSPGRSGLRWILVMVGGASVLIGAWRFRADHRHLQSIGNAYEKLHQQILDRDVAASRDLASRRASLEDDLARTTDPATHVRTVDALAATAAARSRIGLDDISELNDLKGHRYVAEDRLHSALMLDLGLVALGLCIAVSGIILTIATGFQARGQG